MAMRRTAFLYVFLVASLCTGCGEKAGPSVSGSVTYNGSPVASGSVAFSSTGEGRSFGAQIVGGKYTAETAYEGQYIALITADAIGAIPSSREDFERQRTANQSQAAALTIPENAEGNGQTVEITGGAQTLDFKLTSPPQGKRLL